MLYMLLSYRSSFSRILPKVLRCQEAGSLELEYLPLTDQAASGTSTALATKGLARNAVQTLNTNIAVEDAF